MDGSYNYWSKSRKENNKEGGNAEDQGAIHKRRHHSGELTKRLFY